MLRLACFCSPFRRCLTCAAFVPLVSPPPFSRRAAASSPPIPARAHLRCAPAAQVAPDHRPGCYCKLDVAKFTTLTAATTALTKMILDLKGELPPEAEPRIIRVEKKFYYDDV